jgi:hypothetical protein
MKAKTDKLATAQTVHFPNKHKDLKTITLKCTITNQDQPLNLELTD